MLRQVGLIAGGCQLSQSAQIQAMCGRYIFCSTMSVYIVDEESFVVESVISTTDTKICSFRASPGLTELVSVDTDGLLSTWSIPEVNLLRYCSAICDTACLQEKLLHSIALNRKDRILVDWQPFVDDVTCIIICEPSISCCLW